MNLRDRFKKARNFAVYYGFGCWTTLRQYDVAVVEPAGQGPTGLAAMQEAGTLVLAYLSVMELNRDFPEFGLLRTDDFLTLNGNKVMNEEYGNFLADLSSGRWKGLLAHKAARLLGKEGYDGLFLDTVGDVEDPGWPGPVRDAQLIAAVNIISELRSRWSEHIIVQNNGLERLAAMTAGLVDGICWENPGTKDAAPVWVERVTARLDELKRTHGTQVLILQEIGRSGEDRDAAGTIAREHDFLFCRVPEKYLRLE